MTKNMIKLSIFVLLMVLIASGGILASDKVDFDQLYDEVSELEGEEAYEFFVSLEDKDLTQDEVINFFVNLPISEANEQIYEKFQSQDFATHMDGYPSGDLYDDFTWEIGMGSDITGPFSEQNLRLPFTDYLAIEEGEFSDPDKTYEIGITFHGFEHSWLINWADAAKWQVDQHPNVEATVLDAGFDDSEQASHVDQFIATGKDGIVVWPQVVAPTGPPARRAEEAGIPVVSVDRLTGYDDVTARVTGNFPANGAQNGMYLIWQLGQEGSFAANVVMLRKPLGSTADAVRTGHFLKILSYFPEIEILQSYHDPDSREEAYDNAETALTAYDEIDVFFNTGDHQALAAYEAISAADRMHSREEEKKIMILSIDDSREALNFVQEEVFELNTPYTPLISDIGVRALLMHLDGQEVPHDIITPDIPMVTPESKNIFGLNTLTVDEWLPHAFGPEY